MEKMETATNYVKVDFRKFVELWYAHPRMDDFCRHMGMDRRKASNLAGYMRKRGVVLPKKLPGEANAPVDWNGLKLLANRLHDQQQAAKYRNGDRTTND